MRKSEIGKKIGRLIERERKRKRFSRRIRTHRSHIYIIIIPKRVCFACSCSRSSWQKVFISFNFFIRFCSKLIFDQIKIKIKEKEN